MEISIFNRFLKRAFDILFSASGLIFLSWLIFLAYIIAAIDTKKNGFFVQLRIGRNGESFKAVKLRTMREVSGIDTSVTTTNDPRITPFGSFFRKTKIDELPQLINVFLGQMSFVGPRPDVPGFADRLKQEDKIILTVRPGITGHATLKYRMEEEILAKQDDPEKYNQEVLYPDKVRINREYVENYSFWKDMKYIWETIFSHG